MAGCLKAEADGRVGECRRCVRGGDQLRGEKYRSPPLVSVGLRMVSK